MSNYKNGLSLCIERINNDTLMSLKITGTLTQEDYKLLTPMINLAMFALIVDIPKRPKQRVK